MGTVVMELDEDKRTVEVPAYLKKIIDRDPQAREFWSKLSFTHQKGLCTGDRGSEKNRNPGQTHYCHGGRTPQGPA
jgi:hypothetical protein